MTLALQQAVDSVYRAFANCRKPATVEGCPCCIDEKNISVLLSKPLRNLTPDDLTLYASSALLTVGTADDFLYFLPRILEILAADSGWWPGPEVVSHAMLTAEFHDWPNTRREAVLQFIDTKFSELLDTKDAAFEIDSWICALGRLHMNLAPFLKRIAACESQLIEYYEENSQPLMDDRLTNEFWDDAPEGKQQVVDWFHSAEIKAAINRHYGLT